MATNEEELFTHLEYVPAIGGFLEPGLPSEHSRSLKELSGGRLDLMGGNIVHGENRRILGRVSTTRGAYLELGTAGTVLLSNIVEKRRLSTAMGSDAIPRARIEGDLTVFGDAFPTDVNRMITLAPRGNVIYVDDGKLPGKGAYTRVRTAIFGDAGPPMKNDLGRIATPDDLLIRGVAGWLSRNAPAAIERLKLGGFELPDGTVTVSGSDIVRAIAANISVTPLVTYILQEAP